MLEYPPDQDSFTFLLMKIMGRDLLIEQLILFRNDRRRIEIQILGRPLISTAITIGPLPITLGPLPTNFHMVMI